MGASAAVPALATLMHSDMGVLGWLSAIFVGLVLAVTLAVMTKRY